MSNALMGPFSFTLVLTVSIIVVWYSYKFRYHRDTPSAVTSIGILGTFIGIFIGLLFFDTQQLTESIPGLLDGLKIAFITSIVGISAAVTLKTFGFTQADEEEHSGATADTIANLIQAGNQQQEKRLAALERSITGDGESTLLTQIQKLRTTTADKQDALIEEFRSFKDEMADNNTEALIEALEQVMRDFNTRLNEHFGDNFKRLNEGVEKMVQWQEDYKNQMKDMLGQWRDIQESVKEQADILDEMGTSMNQISNRSEALVDVSDRLQPLVEKLDSSHKKLGTSLDKFSNLGERAEGVFPAIEQTIDDLTDNLSNSVEESIEEMNAGLVIQRKNFEQLQKNYEKLDEKAEAHIEQILKESGKTINKLIEENNQVVLQKIEMLDQTLEEELTKSLESLGSQLASLSDKFVSDYGPLTEKLRDVVELANYSDGQVE